MFERLSSRPHGAHQGHVRLEINNGRYTVAHDGMVIDAQNSYLSGRLHESVSSGLRDWGRPPAGAPGGALFAFSLLRPNFRIIKCHLFASPTPEPPPPSSSTIHPPPSRL